MNRLFLKRYCGLAVAAFCLLIGVSSLASASDSIKVRGSLIGFNEVSAVVTTGNGKFRARLDIANGQIVYKLSYDGVTSRSQAAPVRSDVHHHFSVGRGPSIPRRRRRGDPIRYRHPCCGYTFGHTLNISTVVKSAAIRLGREYSQFAFLKRLCIRR